MNKKITTSTIFGLSIIMIVSWAVIYFTGTREQQINYWWQAGLAFCPILFGIFGLLAAKKWSWLKSGVGQSVFFISLGLIVWGVGQAGWTYFLFRYPGQESPPSHLLDVIDISTIPIWIYGILKLSRVAGARYGLKRVSGKILIVVLPVVMTAISYYFLVIVARGGSAYFEQPFWNAFFDLGYAIGDSIILTIALVIFGLSWKILGGRFRKPIILIILGFALLYLADFAFSYSDGKGEYYNGNAVDLLFLLMIFTLGLALNMFSPSRLKKANTQNSMYDPAQPQPSIPTFAPTSLTAPQTTIGTGNSYSSNQVQISSSPINGSVNLSATNSPIGPETSQATIAANTEPVQIQPPSQLSNPVPDLATNTNINQEGQH